MKKAGQQIADAARQLPSGNPSSGDPSMPSDPSQQAGGEWDPLIPESDQASQSDSDTFMEEDAQAQNSASSDSSSAESSEQTASSESASGAESDDLMMPEETASAGGQSDDFMMQEQSAAAGGQAGDMMMQEDIEAAREAMEQAGIDLQRAGELLETASTDEELAAAQQEIAKARLSVIVAGQDLLDIQNIITDPTVPSGEEIFQEADESLEEGNVAIVIATESILDLPNFNLPQFSIPGMPSSGQSGPESNGQSGGGSPGSPTGTPGIAGGFPGGSGEPSELDKELNESIAIFEGKILDARNEVLGSAPPPTSSENVPGVAVLGGTGTLEGEGTFEENTQEGLEAGIPEVIEQGRMPEGSDIAKSGEMPTNQIPEDIPDAQGDDIVAKQLRELAIAETDPELKEKLWDEYRKYKAGL